MNLSGRRDERKPGWQGCLPFSRRLVTVSLATARSTTLSNPKRNRKHISFSSGRGLPRKGQSGGYMKEKNLRSLKGKGAKKKGSSGKGTETLSIVQ